MAECACDLLVPCVHLPVAHERSSVVLPGLAVVALAQSFLPPVLESAH